MSQGSYQWSLEEGETILWQGRPAPRCYTFRHWLQATIGTILFLASSFWLMVGVQLVRAHNYSWWLAVAPLLLAIAAFFVGPGQLVLARLRWEEIFYALTDQRLLVRNSIIGRSTSTYQLCDYKQFKQKQYGQRLASIRLSFNGSAPIILECLEHPENFLDHLPKKESKSATTDSV
ncbi:MAG: hypothetical protein QNK24_07150 [Desulfuromusa sp.]|nr:hypothetical protein [Desulfuromusa sp.]